MTITIREKEIEGRKGKKKVKTKIIEEMVIPSTIYPEIKIEQLDLCGDMKETCSVWLNVCADIEKKDLLKLFGVISRSEHLWGAEIPYEIVIRVREKKRRKNSKEDGSRKS